MADVAADIHAEVTSDGARGGVAGLGGSEQLSALSSSVLSLPNHGQDGGGLHELDQTAEERLGAEVGIVSLEVSLRGFDELHSDELETLLLESGNNGSAQVALNTVRLNHDERSLLLIGHVEQISTSGMTLELGDRTSQC